jgi:glutathione S-transferase
MTSILLDVPVTLKLVDLAKGEQRTPEYRRLNPNGKVPTLVDGDLALWESHAIMTYLADKTPGNALYPQQLEKRADVNRWLYWSSAHYVPPIGTLNFENMLKPQFGMGEPDAARVKQAEADLRLYAGILDRHLESRQWVANGAMSLADISLACPLMSTVPAKLPVQDFKHVQAWLSRVQSLDAWKRTNPPS